MAGGQQRAPVLLPRPGLKVSATHRKTRGRAGTQGTPETAGPACRTPAENTAPWEGHRPQASLHSGAQLPAGASALQAGRSGLLAASGGRTAMPPDENAPETALETGAARETAESRHRFPPALGT